MLIFIFGAWNIWVLFDILTLFHKNHRKHLEKRKLLALSYIMHLAFGVIGLLAACGFWERYDGNDIINISLISIEFFLFYGGFAISLKLCKWTWLSYYMQYINIIVYEHPLNETRNRKSGYFVDLLFSEYLE